MTQMGDIRLVPLRVPAGFVVRHNGFFAIDLESDLVSDSALVKYLVEDLLYIKAEDRDIKVDLSWSPDMDISGKYLMSVSQDDEDVPLAEYASRSYHEIATQIESCLSSLCHGMLPSYEQLVPLRIVSGWHVDLNEFTRDLAASVFDGDIPKRVLHLRKPYYSVDDISITLDFHPKTLLYYLTFLRAEDTSSLKNYQDTNIDTIVAVLEQWIKVAHLLSGNNAADMLAPDGSSIP